jgi:hypothetical protein
MALFPTASLLALAAAVAEPPHSDHDHARQLGKVSFPTSCNYKADVEVQRGLAWLHSFEYEQAARVFSDAATADPDCAIAHWGVAASYYHPLWAPPTPSELEKGRAALAKAKAASAASEREREYIATLEPFFRDADTLDHKTRSVHYSAALEQLHKRYPADNDAAVFYALSLIAAGMLDQDPDFAKEKTAGAILNRVLAAEPDHPGVAHYLIHSFDYPQLASLALPAARRYASIAPASPHAQHMPSHIFVRLGLWDETIKSNLASEAAARGLAKEQGLPGSSSERLHAMDYLAYGYLQTGQDERARRVLAELNAIQRADPPVFSVAYAATAIPVRIVLEQRRWNEAASLKLADNVRNLAPLDQFKWAQAHSHFARAVGAARIGAVARAREDTTSLKGIEEAVTVPAGSYDWRTQVSIQRQIAEAWLAYAEGRGEEALRMMAAAADLDDRTEKHPVTPGAITPAREQLGELLIELNRPAEALVAYEASLSRGPRRLAGIYGAARSARQSGRTSEARAYYKSLLELAGGGDGDRDEVREAKAFETSLSAR